MLLVGPPSYNDPMRGYSSCRNLVNKKDGRWISSDGKGHVLKGDSFGDRRYIQSNIPPLHVSEKELQHFGIRIRKNTEDLVFERDVIYTCKYLRTITSLSSWISQFPYHMSTSPSRGSIPVKRLFLDPRSSPVKGRSIASPSWDKLRHMWSRVVDGERECPRQLHL